LDLNKKNGINPTYRGSNSGPALIGTKESGHCGTELDLYRMGCLQLRGKKVEVN
jgi:hypothetical protein